MVLQVLADAGQVQGDLDAEPLRWSAGPIPARINRAGMQRAGGQHDLAGRDFLGDPGRRDDADADAMAALHDQSLDEGFGTNGQVGPVAHLGREIGHGRRHAPITDVGHGDRKVARHEIAVLIV